VPGETALAGGEAPWRGAVVAAEEATGVMGDARERDAATERGTGETGEGGVAPAGGGEKAGVAEGDVEEVAVAERDGERKSAEKSERLCEADEASAAEGGAPATTAWGPDMGEATAVVGASGSGVVAKREAAATDADGAE